MYSLQQLSLCRIPFGKLSKSVHFLHCTNIKKEFCRECREWLCTCLFEKVVVILKCCYKKIMWIVFHMPSSVIVYSSVDFSILYNHLVGYRHTGIFSSFNKFFEWNGYSDDILVENSACLNVIINNAFESGILCDIYSRLLLNLRKKMDYHHNCPFIKFMDLF